MTLETALAQFSTQPLLKASRALFKDTLQIESFDDPKVQGVTLYISNFQRPITERLTSNFLQDPSYASVVR